MFSLAIIAYIFFNVSMDMSQENNNQFYLNDYHPKNHVFVLRELLFRDPPNSRIEA